MLRDFGKKNIKKKAEMLGRAMGRNWKPENPSACSAVESWTIRSGALVQLSSTHKEVLNSVMVWIMH